MKRLLLTLFFLTPCLALAQAIPNGIFETWVPNPAASDTADKIPNTWSGFGLPGALTRIAPGQSGAYALNIKAGNFGGIPFPMNIVNQFPVIQTYKYLNGYVRKTAGAGDTLSINCLLFSRAAAGGVATGFQQKITLAADWTPFSMELSSFSSIAADSAVIVVQVSGLGSDFDLDNFTFSNSSIGGPLATHSKLNSDRMAASIYPNPVVDEAATLNIGMLLGNSLLQIRIIDAAGRTARTETYSISSVNEDITLNTVSLIRGMYDIIVENAGRRIVLPFIKD